VGALTPKLVSGTKSAAPPAGLRYRVRDVFRAAGALMCLGRWLHRSPT
jgi:hypothetical protein